MNNKHAAIKKKIGEKLYNFLSRNFSGDFLSANMPKVFAQLKDCRKIVEYDFPKVKQILNALIEDDSFGAESDSEASKDILDRLGYELFETKTREEYLKFKKYYAAGEALCKFTAYDATSRYGRVFWLVKKDIDKIVRSDFSKPDIHDAYSTSLMSIGVSKDLENVAQICSRYNHAVNGCDNVFNSNLDNIHEGLTDAFNRDFGLSLKEGTSIALSNFYISGVKYHYYSHEILGHKISSNCIDGKIYNPDHFLIFDSYILDKKNRKISNLDDAPDAFVDEFQRLLDEGFKVVVKHGELDEEEDDEGKIIIYQK